MDDLKRFFETHKTLQLVLTAVLIVIVGVFWIYFAGAPWQGFLDSDHVVPLSQTIEPWKLRDLFYWGTTRFGMPYELFWKAFVSPWLGVSVSSFYIGHIALYFLGLGFWLSNFRSSSARVIFFFFSWPILDSQVYYFLFPGQPYGVLFFLGGCFETWRQRFRESARYDYVLGLIIFIAIYQHVLFGGLLFAVYLVDLFATSNDLNITLKRFCRYLITILPLMVILQYFKHRIKLFDGSEELFTFVSRPELKDNLKLLAKTAIPTVNVIENLKSLDQIQAPSIVKIIANFILTFSAFISLIVASFNLPRFKVRKSKESLVIAGYLLFALFMVIPINLSRWYVMNARGARYYQTIIPVLIFGVLRTVELLPTFPRKVATGIMSIFILCYLIQPEQMIFTQAQRLKREASVQQWTDRVKTLERLGCFHYIDTYPNSHVLVAFSDSRITSSASYPVRNPAMFNEIKSSKPFCVGSTNLQLALPSLEERSKCTENVQEGVFVCWP